MPAASWICNALLMRPQLFTVHAERGSRSSCTPAVGAGAEVLGSWVPCSALLSCILPLGCICLIFNRKKKKIGVLVLGNGAFNAVPKPEDPRFPISSTGVEAPGCAEAPTASPSLRLIAHGRQGCADSPALLQSPGAHKLSLCSACLSALSPEMMVHLRIISSSGELPPSSLKLSIFKMPAASRIKKPRLMYRCLQCIIQSPFSPPSSKELH